MKKTKEIKHSITLKEINSDGIVIDVEHEYSTFIVEYYKERNFKPIYVADGESIISLSNACVTSILSKGVTPKVIEIYEKRNSERLADFQDLSSTFTLALLSDAKERKLTTFDDESIHNAYLAVYNAMYEMGTTKAGKNPRYSQLSINQLCFDEDGKEITPSDNALMVMFLGEKNVNPTCIEWDGVKVNRKALNAFKMKVESHLSSRQIQVFNYYLDGTKKSDIAQFIGVSRPTVYKDIATIESTIKEIALSFSLFQTATVK